MDSAGEQRWGEVPGPESARRFAAYTDQWFRPASTHCYQFLVEGCDQGDPTISLTPICFLFYDPTPEIF